MQRPLDGEGPGSSQNDDAALAFLTELFGWSMRQLGQSEALLATCPSDSAAFRALRTRSNTLFEITTQVRRRIRDLT